MIIYGGLSVDAGKLKKKYPQFEFRPPIRRGQIYDDFEAGHRVFLIADGEFDQSLAVSAGEIMDIIRAGGLVFGSSSMGALRAAEMYEYGMIGVGEIYELVRSTDCFMDDWLGHLFDNETLEMLTLPFVELLFVFKPYVRGSLAEFGKKLARQKKFRYDSFTHEKCRQFVSSINLKNKKKILAEIDRLFSKKRVSQKQKDAEAMLAMAIHRLEFVERFNKTIAGLNPIAKKISAPKKQVGSRPVRAGSKVAKLDPEVGI